jgi:hypothetical protein
VAIIFIAISFGHAEARDHPVPFPFMTDGLDELNTLVLEKKQHIPISSQEIDLESRLKLVGSGLKLVGFFQSYGSGIETINAYIYTCEIGKCKLFVFLRTWKSQVSMALLEKTKELILKSHDGTIIFRMPFPFM